jgi:hypothetical protein
MRAVLKNIPKKDKKEVAYMLKDALKMSARCRNWRLFLMEWDIKSQQIRLMDSDLTFGIISRFLDSTGEGSEPPTAWRESTRS